MNKYRQAVIICLLGLFSSGLALAEKPKIATVDMQKLFGEYHRTVVELEKINAEHAKIQRTISEKTKEVTKMRRAIETIAAEMRKEGLSQQEKVEKQQTGQLIVQEVKIAQRAIERFTEVEQAKLEANKTVMMQNLLDEVKKNVSELSRKIGYDYVFDRSGLNTNQVSFFLYLKDATDITEIVLKELNDSANSDDDE